MMRLHRLIPIFLLWMLSMPGVIHADQPASVYDAIQGGKGNAVEQQSNNNMSPNLSAPEDSSLFPLIVKLVVSLAFIIGLIYLSLKFWAAKTRTIQTRGPFSLLGGCAVGTNRSIQAVLIGQTIYIVGIGDNVQLLRSITKGEEYELILNSIEAQAEAPSIFDAKRWFQKAEKQPESWDDLLQAELRQIEQGEGTSLDQWMKGQGEESRKS